MRLRHSAVLATASLLLAVAVASAQSLGEAQDLNALKQFRLQVERARYEAERAERRFRNVEPENRLVARTLESEWDNKLHEQRAAEAELARAERIHVDAQVRLQQALGDLEAAVQRPLELGVAVEQGRPSAAGSGPP